MSKIATAAIAALLALQLSGCTPEPEPQGVIPQGMLDAMDKAAGVEDVLKQAEKKIEEEEDSN